MVRTSSPTKWLLVGTLVAALGLGWLVLGNSPGSGSKASRLDIGSETVETAGSGPSATLAEGSAAASEATVPLASRQAAGRAPTSTPRAPTATKSAPKSGPQVLGRVLGIGGLPVSGAEVEMERGEQITALLPALGSATKESATTDGFGRFALPAKPNTLVRFKVKAEGYLEWKLEEFMLPQDLRAPLQDFVLSPSATLRGQVVDSRGRAVQGAAVFKGRQFMNFGGGKNNPDATADEQGRFELDGLELGDWRLRVEAESYPTRIFRGTLTEPGDRAPAVRLELPLPATIRGQAQGVPERQLARIRVRAQPKGASGPWDLERASFAPLQAEGRFELQSLDPELNYELALLPASEDMISAMGFAGLRSEPVLTPAGSNSVTLTYQPGANLSFRVIDSQSRQPVESFTAVLGQGFALSPLTGANNQALTFHKDGLATFDDIHPAAMDLGGGEKWKLRVDADGYVSARLQELEIPERGELNLGDIEIAQAPIVTVRVLDAKSGKPVRSAQVRLTRASTIMGSRGMNGMDEFLGEKASRDRTDGKGEVRLSSFAEDASRLTVSKSGYAVLTVEDLVVGQEPRTVEVQLFEEGEVDVLVVDTEGQPVRGARVTRQGPPNKDGDRVDTENQQADGAGRVLFRKLSAGEHRFSLGSLDNFFNLRIMPEEAEQPQQWETIQVAAGGKGRLTLVAPARSDLEVFVRQRGTNPSEVRVHAYPVPAGEEYAAVEARALAGETKGSDTESTDAAGRAVFERLERGRYLIAATPPQSSVPALSRVDLRQARQSLNIDLPGGSVSGRVIDRAGRPVAGVRVSVAAEGGRANFGWNGRSWQAQRQRDEARGIVLVGEPEASRPGETDSEGRFTLDSLPSGIPMQVWASGDRVIRAKSEVFTLAVDEQRSGVEVIADRAGKLVVDLVQTGTSRPGMVQVRATQRTEEGEGQSNEQTSFGQDTVTLQSMLAGTWKVTVTGIEIRRDADGSRIVDDDKGVVIDEREVVILADETTRYSVNLP